MYTKFAVKYYIYTESVTFGEAICLLVIFGRNFPKQKLKTIDNQVNYLMEITFLMHDFYMLVDIREDDNNLNLLLIYFYLHQLKADHCFLEVIDTMFNFLKNFYLLKNIGSFKIWKWFENICNLEWIICTKASQFDFKIE